jgi:hypothetical protein
MLLRQLPDVICIHGDRARCMVSRFGLPLNTLSHVLHMNLSIVQMQLAS